MKYILTFILILVCAGCTPLVVKEPIGNNYAVEKLKDFEGIWILKSHNEESSIVHLRMIDEKGKFQYLHVEWDEGSQHFKLDESEVVIKKGTKYGILNYTMDDQEHNPHNLLLVTLFQLNENGNIEYWYTNAEKIDALLSSGLIETEELDDTTVMTAEPNRIIHFLESNFDHIFDTESTVTVKKLVQPGGR
jgi:hypothetical protein